MRRQAILLLMAVAAAMIVAGGVAYAANFDCDTEADQDPDPGQCKGTEEADDIHGTGGPDRIRALAGDDRVFGNDGKDEIYMDEGNDLVDAMVGNDIVYGGPDGDGTAAGATIDQINLEGAEESDKVYGGGGDDWIDAAANDTGGSVDRSFGGKGNDFIYAIDNNNDIINCGRGKNDVAHIDSEATLDTNVTGCEQVFTDMD